MKIPVICSLLLGAILIGTATAVFTAADLATAQAALQEILDDDRELIPEFVRLSFHDCVGDDGCNGCVDINTAANKGLIRAVELADSLWKTIASELSRADFYALIGTEAVRLAMDRSGNSAEATSIPFYIGRKTCANILPDIQLPAGQTLDTVKFFSDQFGMTPREATAIMGGHSLGEVHKENAGFHGVWDTSQEKLDNKYYENMVEKQYKVERVDNEIVQSFQWAKGNLMQLPADQILYFNYEMIDDFTPSCEVQDCPIQSDTGPIVEEFANDEETFHNAFKIAFLKMISKTAAGVPNLTDVK